MYKEDNEQQATTKTFQNMQQLLQEPSFPEIIIRFNKGEEILLQDVYNLDKKLEEEPELINFQEHGNELIHILYCTYEGAIDLNFLQIFLKILKHMNTIEINDTCINHCVDLLEKYYKIDETEIFFEYLCTLLNTKSFQYYMLENEDDRINMCIIFDFLEYCFNILLVTEQHEKHNFLSTGIINIIKLNDIHIEAFLQKRIDKIVKIMEFNYSNETLYNNIITVILQIVDNFTIARIVSRELHFLKNQIINQQYKVPTVRLYIAIGKYMQTDDFIHCSFELIDILIKQYDQSSSETKNMFIFYILWITKTFSRDDFYDFLLEFKYPICTIIDICIDICKNCNQKSILPTLEIIIYFLSLPPSDFQIYVMETINTDDLDLLLEICDEIEEEEVFRKTEFFKICMEDFFRDKCTND